MTGVRNVRTLRGNTLSKKKKKKREGRKKMKGEIEIPIAHVRHVFTGSLLGPIFTSRNELDLSSKK